MRVGILGPIEVSIDDRPTTIDTAKERALLAVLAARSPDPVPVSTLVDALWGDDPPATAERTLASHVSRLRRAVGSAWVINDAPGYRLDAAVEVDALELAELVDAADHDLDAGRIRAASQRAAEARTLWRGEPLTDLADTDVRRADLARFVELRRRATAVWIAAELRLGRHVEIIGDIEAAVHDDPLNEALWGQLMTALYRSGRQADALRAFGRLRRRLHDELGIEPSPEIARVELAILRQDPRLDIAPPPPPDNLPGEISSFVGRDAEMRSVHEALDGERLVTLVGPGGIGKSRLARAVAGQRRDRYPDGTWWVDLASARRRGDVVTRLASSLEVTLTAGDPLDHIGRRLGPGARALIVFDNCEHLRAAVGSLVQQLLESAPGVEILCTSRALLGLAGEVRFVVPPMSTPTDDVDALLSFDAVRLFVDRAASANGASVDPDDLEAVASICRRLDGVPLALELAASRSIAFPPRLLAARLDERVTSLAERDDLHDPRYASIDDAIHWSCELLDTPDRDVFMRLSVFEGSFDVEAITAVCHGTSGDPLEAVAHLVDASLLDTVGTEPGRNRSPALDPDAPRFRLLTTIRDHALRQLDADTAHEVRCEHAVYFRTLVTDLVGDGSITGDSVRRLRRDEADVAAALDWSRAHDDPRTAFDFAVAIATAWQVAGDFDGSVRLLDAALELPVDAPDRRGWANYRLVWPLILLGDVDRAAHALTDAEACAARSGDARLLAVTRFADAHGSFLVLGDIDRSLPLYERALEQFESIDSLVEEVAARLGFAQALVLADRPERVGEIVDHASDLLRRHPDDGQQAHLCLDRALLAWCVGDIEAIDEFADAGQHHARAAGNSFWEQINLTAAGFGSLLTGDLAQAEITLVRAARYALDDGNLLQYGLPVQGLAATAAARGDASTAALLFGAGAANTPDWPLIRRGLADYVTMARTALGGRFASLVERGRSTDPHDAWSIALESGSSAFERR